MQRFGTVSTWDYLEELEHLHRRLPPLQDIFARWQNTGMSSLPDALTQRELVLGVATLSGASLRLLYHLASPYVKDLPERIYWHAPTHSAAETQAVLPSQVLVQKTVSVEMAGRLLLWTSVGEQATRSSRGDPLPRRLACLDGLPSSAQLIRPPVAQRRNLGCCLAWSRLFSRPFIPVA